MKNKIGFLRKFVSIGILSSLLILGSSKSLRAIENDKVIHSEMAAAIGGSCALAGRLVTDNTLLAGVGCFVILNTLGVVKELTDPLHGGQREGGDLVANLLGSGVGIFTISLTFGIGDQGRRPKEEIHPLQISTYKTEAVIAERSEPVVLNNDVIRFELVGGELKETRLKAVRSTYAGLSHTRGS